MKISLPHNKWFGCAPVELNFPENWIVSPVDMRGDSYPVLTWEQVKDKIDHPIGCSTIAELAAGKNSACILFDDMSRATPTKQLAHIVLDELLCGGIKKENITFICAGGLHSALELDDFIKKLGADIVRDYPVYNHNPFENVKTVGTTTRGFEARVNAEVLEYDLKIGLGAIVPHPIAGFGGGCKTILPGICSADTITRNHKSAYDKIWLNRERPFVDTFGDLNVCDMREDAEEVAMMAGFDFKIDVMFNTACEVVDVSAGHPIKSFYDGVKRAFDIYRSEKFDPVDVCVINANSKSNEAFIALAIGMDCLKDGGDIVLVNHNPSGIVNHYLSSMWGRYYGSPLTSGNKDKDGLPSKVKRMIILSPYPQYTATISYGRPDQVLWAKDSDELFALLADRGEGTTAAIFKDAFLQMFYDPFKEDYTPTNIALTKEFYAKKEK